MSNKKWTTETTWNENGDICTAASTINGREIYKVSGYLPTNSQGFVLKEGNSEVRKKIEDSLKNNVDHIMKYLF